MVDPSKLEPNADEMPGITTFWGWRDYHRRGRSAAYEQASEYFRDRAQEVADLVSGLLSGGLSEGAEEALAALAEEDAQDFCILIDLAEGVEIPGVNALEDDRLEALQMFLDHEPWHSLMVDVEISLCIAMLEDYGRTPEDVPWYRSHPEVVSVCAQMLDGVNQEQLNRFVGDVNFMADHDDIRLDEDVASVVRYSVSRAADRLGVKVPEFLGSTD